MPPRPPPSAHALVDVDLDTLAALQLFLGMSQADAYEMYALQSRGAQELRDLSAIGFEFYLEPAVRYVTSPHADGDWEILLFLLGSVAHQIQHRRITDDAARLIRELVNHIQSNMDKFHVEQTRNGPFITDSAGTREQLAEIETDLRLLEDRDEYWPLDR